MRKLKLDLDELAVESFDTEREQARGRGTLFGRDSGTLYTEEISCEMTCGTCANSYQWRTCIYSCLEPTDYNSCQPCVTSPVPCLE